tara:strand:- start:156 stop:350 length:195 start_codon:yes stop_codon:yes gene_type:complete
MTTQQLNEFFQLAMALSPENLHMDGEATIRQANQRRKVLMNQWRKLEKSVGRKVTETEILIEFS